ncbi:hypothetical protein LAZ40_09495 [Cereibacter sphaeroides]|uniref:hypothetical protein n=1 Tax=Cereibacter sphaeroides TaxID=1063 RepID=UPI001F379019|nr:hypothetical protein [Cereibacter sphaeroides]MCE6959286.1 hypothetical protein [Cereibacter sphaeroides]MCE6972878.1 hypothetical protein [Cereibacter sphaeroides]
MSRIVAIALAAAVASSAAPLEAKSLDGFLKGVEFCQESKGFRGLRKQMNALIPISNSPVDRKYEIGPKLMRQMAAAIPAKVTRAEARETDGHMSWVLYLSDATYAGVPIDYVNVWNGNFVDDSYGFAVMFRAPYAQVGPLFEAPVAWANNNRYRQDPPFTATLTEGSPGIICSAWN